MAAATATSAKQAPPTEGGHSAEYEHQRSELMKIISSQEGDHHVRHDLVAGQYLIKTNSPLPEFNTALNRAFVALDERDSTHSLYALVCDPHTPTRNKLIKELHGANLTYAISLIAMGSAPISGMGRRYVLIFERPRGKSLTSILNERGKAFPERFIAEYIIGPLAKVLQRYHELGISHGRINPDNIFFADSVSLGECVSEPCGYSQPFQFETPARAQAHPAAKGEGTVAQDYYALGVLAAYLRFGPRLFDDSPTADAHVLRLLRNGSYLAYSRNVDFSDMMTDLLRGSLNDTPQERWTYEQLYLWSRGRRFNMLPPSSPTSGTRPFYIGHDMYQNTRDLAQGLFTHWELTRQLLHDKSLTRWVELSVGRRDMGEALRKATHISNITATPAQLDEMVCRSLIVLDSQAPISLRELRVHVDGIGAMLAEAVRTNHEVYKQDLLEIIDQGMANYWADLQKKAEESTSSVISDALWQLDRMRMLLRQSGYGFGVERVLYEMNPSLSCQSPLLEGEYVGTVKELLNALEHVAQKKARGEPPIDRHIAAFICCKQNTLREAEISELARVPRISKDKAIIALRLLQQAYVPAGRPRLPALTAWIAAEVLKVLDQLRSNSLRKDLQGGVVQVARSGSIEMLYDLINQRSYVEADFQGYRDAVGSYFQMGDEIVSYKNRKLLRRRAQLTGHAIAKQISHATLLAIMLSYIWKYWL